MRWFSHMHVGNLVSCVNQAVIIPLCRLPEVRQSKESWLKVACFIQRTDCWCYGITHTSSHLGIIRGCVYESPHRGTAPCESLEGWHNQQITNVAHLIKSNQPVRGHLLFNQPSGSHGTSLGLKKKKSSSFLLLLVPFIPELKWTECVYVCVRVLGDWTRGNGPKSECNETPQINFQSHLQLQAEREEREDAKGRETLREREKKRERERRSTGDKGMNRKKKTKKEVHIVRRAPDITVCSINQSLFIQRVCNSRSERRLTRQ